MKKTYIILTSDNDSEDFIFIFSDLDKKELISFLNSLEEDFKFYSCKGYPYNKKDIHSLINSKKHFIDYIQFIKKYGNEF